MALSACIVLSSGCLHRQEDELTQAVVAGEHKVAMEGRASYFGGTVAVHVTVGRGIGKGYKRERSTLTGGGSKFDVSSGQTYQEERDVVAKSAFDDYEKGGTMGGSPVPPVTLHLWIENHGTAPVTVKLADFDSELGNFVLDPETLTVGPGATSQPTPMVSELGVSSDEIPFTVTLKLGSAKETQVIKVRNLLDQAGEFKKAQ